MARRIFGAPKITAKDSWRDAFCEPKRKGGGVITEMIDMSARSKRSAKSETCRRLRSAQLEEQLVRKRQAEYERLNSWSNNSAYFKTWEFNASLHNNWAEQNSLEHLQKIEKLKKKQEMLEERRKKLKILLENEEKELQEESKKKTEKPILLEDLNATNIGFLLREEDKRRKERDIKMYHYWRQNQPSLKDFERKLHYDHVKLSWLQQVVEKRKEREAEELKMLEQIAEMKRLEEERKERERELLEERKKTEMELKNFLEKQMQLIKCKEEQQLILKSEESEALKLQNELEDLMEERRKLLEKRKRIDLSLFHKKQFQVLLKTRAKEVQENLEYDRRFLEKIASEKKYELNKNSERALEFKRDLEISRELCKKQAEVEKLRVSQAEYLFDEEAKKMYEKQETQWKMESEARQKLLDSVLKSLQQQIKEKLLENKTAQDEIQKERELMLKALEEANRELKESQEKAKKPVEHWKKDLDQQILEKKLEMYYKRKEEQEDKENLLKAKKEEEEKLCQELTKMYLSGYQPKTFGRKNFMPL